MERDNRLTPEEAMSRACYRMVGTYRYYPNDHTRAAFFPCLGPACMAWRWEAEGLVPRHIHREPILPSDKTEDIRRKWDEFYALINEALAEGFEILNPQRAQEHKNRVEKHSTSYILVHKRITPTKGYCGPCEPTFVSVESPS